MLLRKLLKKFLRLEGLEVLAAPRRLPLGPNLLSRPITTQKRPTTDLTAPLILSLSHTHTESHSQTKLRFTGFLIPGFEPTYEAEPSIKQRQGQFNTHTPNGSKDRKKHKYREMEQTR
jgi:hypothetical protein